jgi:hypothetical protein
MRWVQPHACLSAWCMLNNSLPQLYWVMVAAACLRLVVHWGFDAQVGKHPNQHSMHAA